MDDLTYCEECLVNLPDEKFDYRFDRPVCLDCGEKLTPPKEGTMAKYLITAVQTNVCQVEVEAESFEDAWNQLDDWIEDDLLEYRVDSKWDYTIETEDEDDE